MICCNVCENSHIKLLSKNYQGYRESDRYKIYKCYECDAHFALLQKPPLQLYEIMYSYKETQGTYGALFEKAKKVKTAEDPFQFLLDDIHSYYPVAQFLCGKKNLKILEIGCGYGYLTYALKNKGHTTIGIDVSKIAIDFANKEFGPMFFNGTIDEYRKKFPHERFDLIIALEVIEHIIHAKKMLSACFEVLKQDGTCIITTPNKNYNPDGSIWKTDIPPVHVSWLSPQTIRYLASKFNCEVKFVDFSRHISKNEKINELYMYFMKKKRETAPLPLFDINGFSFSSLQQHPFKDFIKKNFLYARPFRFFSNTLYKNFIHRGINDFFTIGAILSKK